MNIQLSVPDWLSLPMETRLKLAEAFKLHRSGGTITEGGQVKSDGYLHSDLAIITVPKMQEFLNEHEQTDFLSLFDQVLDKINQTIERPVESPPDPNKFLLEEWAAHLLRMKQQATTMQLEDSLHEVINQIFHVQLQRPPTQEAQVHKGAKGRGRKAKANS